MRYSGCTLAIFAALCASRADSQTFRTLLQFSGSSGAAIGAIPYGDLTLAGTTLYGMTSMRIAGGVAIGDGNIFSVGVNGTNYQNLVSFTGTGGTASGIDPHGSLTLSGTTLYGMTQYGAALKGNIFSVGTDGTNYHNLVTLTGPFGPASGQAPEGSLTLGGTTLYGMTFGEAPGYYGNVFSVGTGGSNYQNLVSFTDTGGTASGDEPLGNLTLDGTTLYGMTQLGGANGYGNIFSVGTGGTNYQNLVPFTGTGGTATGIDPAGSLTLGGTTLFGMTRAGGANAYGNVFSVGVNGTNYQNLLSFTGRGGTASGFYPAGSLTLSGTTLYGMTNGGGAFGDGNIFSVGIDGSDYQNLYSFTGGSDGGYPSGDLTLSCGTLFGMTSGVTFAGSDINDGTVFALVLPEPSTLALAGSAAAVLVAYRWRRRRSRRVNRRWNPNMKCVGCMLALGVALCTSGAESQTFTTLLSFTGTGGTAIGESPLGSLTLSGTTLYGMTYEGGARGDGNVFSVGTNGANYQNLFSFVGGTWGAVPWGSLTLSGTTLYGTTRVGGTAIGGAYSGGWGNIFSVGTNGTNYQNVLSFTGTSGAAPGWQPLGNVTLSGTTLYGTTLWGGVFSVGTNGTGYKSLVSFTGNGGTATGYCPKGSLTLSGSTLYGMTSGLDVFPGNVFSVGTNGTNYQNLVSFTGSGSGGTASGFYAPGSLTLSGTTLYGMTVEGGASGDGNIFSVGTGGTNFKNLLSFTGTAGAEIGAYPWGDLTLNGTTLYGMTAGGGADGCGIIFSLRIDGSDFQDLYNFTGGADGGYPDGDLTLSGGTLFGMTSSFGANGDGTVFALTLPTPTPEPGTLALVGGGAVALVSYRWRRRRIKYLALTVALGVALCTSRAESQTFTTLVTFTGTGGTANGANPYGSLTVVGTSLYGMTSEGGTGYGNLFSVGMDGTGFQNLVSFTGTAGTANGNIPYGSLTVAGTTLYGTTNAGGTGYCGNVFSVGTNGTSYQNLVSFTGNAGTANGDDPYGSLTVVGTSLYGMTEEGGTGVCGNVFSVGTNGTNYQNVVSFTGSGGRANGQFPYGSVTVAGSTVFGMTSEGGIGVGNVFSAGTNGTNYRNLVSFTGTGGTANGEYPCGSLLLSGTTLYGMTEVGGTGYGNIFSVGTNGTSFQNLVSFTGTGGAASGEYPRGGLILSGTTLYGMTCEDGPNGAGNVFSVGINGSGYDDLYNFTGGADGAYPFGDLTLSGGTLFGMTEGGGNGVEYAGDGTIFALAGAVAATPEPGTLALVSTAAVVSVAYRWRRRRRRPRRRNRH